MDAESDTRQGASPEPDGSEKRKAGEKLSVFISYSRKDLRLVDQLAQGLRHQGYDVIIDREKIEGGQEFEKRLGEMIAMADTVVFVMTPNSLVSKHCVWEVGETKELGKRLLPVAAADFSGIAVPKELAKLDYIFFYENPDKPGSGQIHGMFELDAALKRDEGWVKEHTFYSRRALEWINGKKADNRLMSGTDIASAKDWMTRRKPDSPEIKDYVRDFIRASEQDEKDRQSAKKQQLEEMKAAQDAREKALGDAQTALENAKEAQAAREVAQKEAVAASKQAEMQAQKVAWRTTAGLVVASVLALVAAGAGVLWYQQAEIARESEAKTKIVTGAAQFTQSGLLAKAVSELTDRKHRLDAGTAILLALEGVPDETSVDESRRNWKPAPTVRGELASALDYLRERAVLKGHGSAVISARFSPDGRRILTASDDKTARLWDAKTGEQIRRFEGHLSKVNIARFSPDGTSILTASISGLNGTTQLWNAKTGAEIFKLESHNSWFNIADFSPDGISILIVSETVMGNYSPPRLWNVKTGAEILKLEGHWERINSAQFSPDGRSILTASDDETVRLWDAKTGEPIRRLEGHESGVNIADFSPDGRRILTASDDKTARLWDAKTGEQIRRFEGHLSKVNIARFSPDSTSILTASDDKTAWIWDAKTGEPISTLAGHEGGVNIARFSPDGASILTASDDETVRLWKVKTGEQIGKIESHQDYLNMAQFSPDGTSILTTTGSIFSEDNTARLWDAKSGELIRKFEGHEGGVNIARFSPDGTSILTT